MKKVITQVILALIAALAALLVVAPVAQAYTDADVWYLDQLSSQGIVHPDGDAGLVIIGHNIVDLIDNGVMSPQGVVNMLYAVTDYSISMDDALFIVQSAVHAYGPWLEHYMPDGTSVIMA